MDGSSKLDMQVASLSLPSSRILAYQLAAGLEERGDNSCIDNESVTH
jgi:hypothetical protein